MRSTENLFADPRCPKCKENNSLVLQLDGYRICRSCGHSTHNRPNQRSSNPNTKNVEPVTSGLIAE